MKQTTDGNKITGNILKDDTDWATAFITQRIIWIYGNAIWTNKCTGNILKEQYKWY